MTYTLLPLATAIAVFTSAAIYALGYLNAEISPYRSFWKTFPVATMAVFVITTGPWLLALALALSAIGDYFLSREEEKFTVGLVSFLTAHLLYIWLFWQITPTASLGWGQGAMAAYALIYSAYLWPRVGEYRFPVLAYIFVITIMVSAAAMLPTGHIPLLLGSLSFAISDSVLALEMFVITNPKTKIALSKFVWVTYVTAQSLLVFGLL